MQIWPQQTVWCLNLICLSSKEIPEAILSGFDAASGDVADPAEDSGGPRGLSGWNHQ